MPRQTINSSLDFEPRELSAPTRRKRNAAASVEAASNETLVEAPDAVMAHKLRKLMQDPRFWPAVDVLERKPQRFEGIIDVDATFDDEATIEELDEPTVEPTTMDAPTVLVPDTLPSITTTSISSPSPVADARVRAQVDRKVRTRAVGKAALSTLLINARPAERFPTVDELRATLRAPENAEQHAFSTATALAGNLSYVQMIGMFVQWARYGALLPPRLTPQEKMLERERLGADGEKGESQYNKYQMLTKSCARIAYHLGWGILAYPELFEGRSSGTVFRDTTVEAVAALVAKEDLPSHAYDKQMAALVAEAFDVNLDNMHPYLRHLK